MEKRCQDPVRCCPWAVPHTRLTLLWRLCTLQHFNTKQSRMGERGHLGFNTPRDELRWRKFVPCFFMLRFAVILLAARTEILTLCGFL